jgi:serine/threonine protein kinase
MLGRGGTSEVYAAKHRERGDEVAVKLVQTSAGVDLVAEATRVRDIAHPNVVRMLDVGSDATSCYLVMELIEGETLAACLGRGPIAESELRELGAAIADGMAAAHALGIVHRDLKPGNVMLRGDVPVIVDFGIAKSLGTSTAAVTERRIGTVAYMAPEQLVEGLITPAVDIWALGVTLYEAATGELPFKSFVDGRLPQLFESAPRITTTSPAFADLVARCLERDPGKRPSSMAEVARVLRGDEPERVTADIGSTSASARSNDDVGLMAASRLTSGSPAKKRWPIVALVVSGVAAIATTIIVTRAPTRPAPISSPATAVERADAAVAPSPVVEVTPSPTTTAPSTTAPPIVKASPPKRAKPRPKPRTTSQGETLD